MDTSKIIFIGGAPRSGTTLVQRIVGSHSLVYGGPEFDLVPEIVRLRNRFHGSVESGRISKYLSPQEVDDLFAKFVALAFSYKLKKLAGKMYVSEKTPTNISVFPELAAMFPDSHLIFVLRDPRAVVASMLQVGERFRKDGKVPPFITRSVRAAIEYINDCWSAGIKVVGRSRNVHVVYYEDIVSSPEETIRKLADGLGLDFEQGMIAVNEYDSPEFKGGERYWYTEERLRAPIMQDSITIWREQLTKYQEYVICRRILRFKEIDRYALSQGGMLHHKLVEFIANLPWAILSATRKAVIKFGKWMYGRIA